MGLESSKQVSEGTAQGREVWQPSNGSGKTSVNCQHGRIWSHLGDKLSCLWGIILMG